MFYRRAAVVGFILAILIASLGCGKGSSNSGTPAVSSLSVSTVTVNSPATTETISGANFSSTSVVNFNGTALTTTYVSGSQLTAIIPASSLTTAGSFTITVSDKGKTSNSITLIVSSSAPTIASLSPGSTIAGSSGFILTVTGTGFNASSVIKWNGNTLPTTYLDSTQLNTSISSSLVASAASIPVTVTTPGTTGGTSTAQTFSVNAPVPTLSSINPTTVFAGSGDITLTVGGTSFIPNSSVQLAGSNRPTVFVSSTQLSATIPAADLASAGSPAVTVLNPAPQGGTSNALPLAITAHPANQPPTANPGFDQTAAVGSTVNLNGYGSSDTDGNRLTFQWTLSARPAGSAAALSNSTTPTPSFVADVAGNYSVQLVVNDGTASSVPATVTISTVNSAPVANAGPNQTSRIGATVQLDGTASSDFDGNRITYAWSLTSVPSGSSATLSSTTSAQPKFVLDKAGNYVASLVVNDGTVSSAPSTVTITTNDTAPVAKAGASQEVPVAATVHLDGNASSDVDGNPLTYSWAITSVPSGSSAALSNPNSIRPTFVADKAGTYLVQLIVDDGTSNSAASTMTVSTVNTPPIANAGPNRTVNAGTLVHLDGSGSSDVDGSVISYRWALISRPAGSAAAVSSTTVDRPTFTADVAGTYVAQLIVRDSQSISVPSTVTISTLNTAPIANAGVAQQVAAGATVQLDGTNSTDVNGNQLNYAWSILSKPATSAAALSDPTVANPSFVADKAGDYILQLIVNDSTAYSAPSTVTVSTSLVAPIANAGSSQLVNIGSPAQLNGSGSVDPNGDTLTYAWSILSTPAGSSAGLSSSTSQQLTITPDVAGDYQLQLVVSNGTLTSAPSETVISTVYAPPVANPGSPQSVNIGTSATLDGSNSRSSGGAALTYKWSLVGVPGGSAAVLTNPASQSPSFTLDKRGVYVAQLIVNDGHTDSAPETVAISSSNRAPIANAGPAQSPVVGTVVTLDGTTSSDPDGYPLTYQWRFTSVPNGSTATLGGTNTAHPTFIGDLIGTYTAELIVNDGLLASAPATVTITVGANTSISFSPSPLALNANQTGNLILSLGQAAGSSGVVVNLTSSNTSVATVPTSVTVPSGSSTAVITVTGLLTAGSTTITGTATGFTTGSVTVNVTVNSISIPNLTVGKNLQATSVVTLGVASSGVDITLTSSDPAKLVISASGTSGGSGTATVHANSGSLASLSFFAQSLADSGTATITAKAPGYVDTTATVTLTPSGIVIMNGISSSLNTTTLAADTTLTVAPAYVDPVTHNFAGNQSIRGGLGTQTIQLKNSTTTVGTISKSSVTLKAGDASTTFTFHPLATGTTDLTATQPTGFVLPSNFPAMHVTVGQPTITMSSVNVGKDLQASDTVYLSAPAPSVTDAPPLGGVDVTVTSADPSKVLLATSATAAGTPSITVHVNAGTQGLPVFYVQALANSGTVTLTATAAGFDNGTTTVGLQPSGFLISSGAINSGSTGDTTVTLSSAMLQPGTLAPSGFTQRVRPGAAPVNVTTNSSNTAVGTITSPVVFNTGASTATATFHPVSAGTTTVSIQTPTGFSTPSQFQSVLATVGLPGMTTNTAINVGKDLQVSNLVTLNAAPSSAVAVTITSNSPAVATVTSDPTVTGSGSVSFNNITASTPSFYIQGRSIGATTLTVSAPGYADATIHVTVGPSGFVMDTTSFRTTAGADTTVSVAPAVLDSSSLNFVALQALRGGLTAQVSMTSGTPSIGTITSPINFNGNQAVGTATFHALTDGSTNLVVGVPAGFSAPTTFSNITASVGLPGLATNTVMTIGKDLEAFNQITLGETPSTAVSVTITANNPSIATVSSDPTMAGSTGVTFNSITSTTPAFYIQGLATGTATFTVSATGYNSATINVTVNPSGFTIATSSFATSVAADTNVTIAAGLLDPANLSLSVLQPVRGGLTLSVPVTSSSTGTGTVTSPVSFTGGQGTGTSTFHAVAVGSSTITVGVPAGFSTPSTNTSITATVQ